MGQLADHERHAAQVPAQVLGHSTTLMFEKHYGHLAAGYVRQAVERTGFELPPEPAAVASMRPR